MRGTHGGYINMRYVRRAAPRR